MDDQTQQLLILAQYTEDTSSALMVTNSYLAVQHEMLLALVAAVIILGVAILFNLRGGKA
jgi:hypothetical protein